ncbi:leucine-rich repeat receptor-like serine/threonine-protein kinase BAM3 [Gossypium australe]|uniref:Leucine-rich repeat receptor-like serine/threonine-protein kinase BAM3 n=1 Tax=Gossypium australe TaxID=47621 RepID=A0A5B6VTJ9_9ROSI|nr:leucine-rich repeat receptor-like serine/threonine-protein kinase BAM3 [Gossypium australe]
MGCGGILRDNDGHLRGIFFGLLGHLDSHIAEVIAIRTAFKLYVESQWFGKFGLVIESDSMVAVAWIRNKVSKPWKLLKLFNDIDVKIILMKMYWHGLMTSSQDTTLMVLSLRSNKLDGYIPHKICAFQNLQNLDLSHNKFSRAIPKCFTNSSAMATKFKHDAA